jgi:hypothetical protein
MRASIQERIPSPLTVAGDLENGGPHSAESSIPDQEAVLSPHTGCAGVLMSQRPRLADGGAGEERLLRTVARR